MHGVVRKLSESGIFGCNGWRKRHFGCVYWKRIKVDVDMKTKKTHERVRLSVSLRNCQRLSTTYGEMFLQCRIAVTMCVCVLYVYMFPGISDWAMFETLHSALDTVMRVVVDAQS